MGTGTVEYVRLWLARAVRDAKAALLVAHHRDPDPVLALYLVQQSTEKACKALLFAAGKSHKEIVGLGHNSLKVFLSFTTTLVQIERMKQPISDLIDPDIHVRLDQVAEWANNTKRNRWFWKELASYDKVIIRKLLGIRNRYQDRRTQTVKLIRSSPNGITIESGQFELANLVSIVKEYVSDNLGHLIENPIDVTPTMAQAFLDTMGISYIPDEVPQTSEITFKSKQISMVFDEQFRFAELIVSLYIMSVITLPHEAFTRYPSNPEDSGKPPLGCEQYDSSIGAIAYIKGLSKRAEVISKELYSKAEVVTTGVRNLLEATRVEREEQARRQAEVERDC